MTKCVFCVVRVPHTQKEHRDSVKEEKVMDVEAQRIAGAWAQQRGGNK